MGKKKTESNFLYSHNPNGMFKLLWGTLENSDNAEVLLEIDETELMNLEKERFGISRDKLVFIGVANLSKYYWCAWQYYLKSKKNEQEFFLAYFQDRLKYSKELGMLKKIPKNEKEILRIGDEINFKQIQNLLDKKQVINSSNEAKEEIMELLKKEDDPLIKGYYHQTLYAENYPSIRWNFRYKDIAILGIPDGITDDFVYEFKYTSKKRYFSHTLRTARLQADFYGHYFNKPKKKIQIYCEEENKVHTYFENVDNKEILELLEKWTQMIDGKLPVKPQSWKCTKCEFKDECILIKS